jgi:phytoene synthase
MRTAAPELTDLYREAAAATSAGSKSFYFATRFFPDELARSAHAVYWFCRTTDDIADECATVEQGRRDLEEWAARLAAAYRGADPAHPVLQVFMDAVRRHGIPEEYPRELLEGMRMDLNGQRYASFDELKLFCYRVASTVGLMMCHVIGFERASHWPEGLARAEQLGIAMQLTNILRDIGEDWRRGRLYLPAEEMERFGVSEMDIARGDRHDGFLRMMDFQICRAREYYRRAEPGIDLLDSRGRFAVRVASDVYREILGRIEKSDYDVFDRRAVVPAAWKYWITTRRMALPVARYSAGRLAFWRA